MEQHEWEIEVVVAMEREFRYALADLDETRRKNKQNNALVI